MSPYFWIFCYPAIWLGFMEKQHDLHDRRPRVQRPIVVANLAGFYDSLLSSIEMEGRAA